MYAAREVKGAEEEGEEEERGMRGIEVGARPGRAWLHLARWCCRARQTVRALRGTGASKGDREAEKRPVECCIGLEGAPESEEEELRPKLLLHMFCTIRSVQRRALRIHRSELKREKLKKERGTNGFLSERVLKTCR